MLSKKNSNGKIKISTLVEKYDEKIVNMSNNELTPHPYRHWMLKEIYEQAETVKRVIKQGSRLMEDDKVHLGD